MSAEKVIEVRWKPTVFQAIKNQIKRSETREKTGLSPVFLDKLAANEKKLSIDRLIDLCQKTNLQPNDFFEIITLKS
jgi:DNA-binding Xre family transcriptional regulator